MQFINITCAIAIIVIIAILYWVRKGLPGLLRDKSELPNVKERPFSLSRTLFFFWTIVVFLSICYIGIVCNKLPEIDQSTLMLMGIVVGTATAGKAIDNMQASDPAINRMQDKIKTESFLTDILSDENGISISRFQTLGFNLIYGGVFIATVISLNKFYQFDGMTLTLLGISSGAYALLKIPENAPAKPVSPPAQTK